MTAVPFKELILGLGLVLRTINGGLDPGAEAKSLALALLVKVKASALRLLISKALPCNIDVANDDNSKIHTILT